MGLVNELKRMVFGEDEAGYYDDEYYNEDEDLVNVPKQPETRTTKKFENNVVNITPSVVGPKERLMISRPKTIDDAPAISDCLCRNMICVVNLEGVDHTNAQRIADFIGGAGYALSCEIESVSNDIFIVAPPHIGVSNSVKDDVKGNILPWISSAFK